MKKNFEDMTFREIREHCEKIDECDKCRFSFYESGVSCEIILSLSIRGGIAPPDDWVFDKRG